MKTKTIKILVAEDHSLVRELLRARLETEADFEVQDVVSTAGDAIDRARELRPDVVLFDIEMPGSSSFDAAAEIRSELPDVRILFVTAYVNDHYIQQALDVRASGYITKYEHPGAIVEAIRTVIDGGVAFSPNVRQRLVVGRDGVTLRSRAHPPLSTLTPRERTILVLVSRGLANKQVADELNISVRTVEHHCEHIMSKLDIHDRVHLTRFAIRQGVVRP